MKNWYDYYTVLAERNVQYPKMGNLQSSDAAMVVRDMITDQIAHF